MNKKYLFVGALIGIAVLGKIAGNMSSGPTVTYSQIQAQSLYGKTVTVNGRIVGKRITVKRTPIMIVRDEEGSVMNVALMPGCNTPALKMGYRYSFTGTPMSGATMACTWPSAVKRLGEYELVGEHKAYVNKERIQSSNEAIDANDGWHNVQVWEDDRGRRYQESVD